MRVLIDTNILLSAMWFKNSRVAKTLIYVVNNHELILCDSNLIYYVLQLKTVAEIN